MIYLLTITILADLALIAGIIKEIRKSEELSLDVDSVLFIRKELRMIAHILGVDIRPPRSYKPATGYRCPMGKGPYSGF